MTTTLDRYAEALFSTPLQPSEHPRAAMVQAAVASQVETLTAVEIAADVAQEYGDHPEAACCRMRWCRRAVAQAFTQPT